MIAHDRRRSGRAHARWPVTVESFNSRAQSGELVDLSLSGMKVRTESDAVVGSAVTVRAMAPKGAGGLEVVARVVRQDSDGMALDFIELPGPDVRRLEQLLAPWEGRRRSPRATVNLPVWIEGRSDGNVPGQTLDLSAFGARIATEHKLSSGDVVVAALAVPDGEGQLRLPALVWEAGPRGVVVLFVGIPQRDFLRLRGYIESLVASQV